MSGHSEGKQEATVPVRLFDSEFRLMELIWEHGPSRARELALIAAEVIGWNKNTTYTLLTRLVERGVLARRDPGFVCEPRVSRAQVQRAETVSLIERMFRGSRKAFLSAFLDGEPLTEDEISMLRACIHDSQEKTRCPKADPGSGTADGERKP